MRNARCLNDARSPGSWQGKNPFLTPGANAPLMRPRSLRYYRGQSLRASRRNTSLRSGPCLSVEHERSKSHAFPAHGEGAPKGRKRSMSKVQRSAVQGPLPPLARSPFPGDATGIPRSAPLRGEVLQAGSLATSAAALRAPAGRRLWARGLRQNNEVFCHSSAK